MSELGRQDPASQQVVSSLLLRWRTDLAAGIRALQATGHAQTVDADTHAGALLAAIQGGVSILLATGSSAELDAVLDLSTRAAGTRSTCGHLTAGQAEGTPARERRSADDRWCELGLRG